MIIRAERIAKSEQIHLALLAVILLQTIFNNYYQAPKPQRTNATSSSTRPSASTRHKGKEIAKPVTPQSESVLKKTVILNKLRGIRICKRICTPCKVFQKALQTTNNHLRIFFKRKNKTEDTTPRYNNDNQSGQFGNQRTMTVAGTRETVGSPVVQQTGIQWLLTARDWATMQRNSGSQSGLKLQQSQGKDDDVKQANKDLKAQMQDKNIAISELKKLIEKCKGKSMETQFDKPSVVRQPNAQRIPKPSVRKPTPFSNSPEMKVFQTKQSRSNLSNVPSSSNSLADGTTHPIPLLTRITKHVTGNLKLLCNFCEEFWVLFVFGNDQFAPNLGYRRCLIKEMSRSNGKSSMFCERSSGKTIYNCKAKRSSFKSKVVPSSKGRLNLLHMDLCGPMRVASINGKKYILVIVDDYSRYTWTLFLRSKDETPEVLKDFLTMIQRNLQAQVISVRTDRGTEFLNKTLHAYFKEEGIEHQTSTPRTPEQNGVVERQNRTLVEAARTMLSASKLPLSFWAEAVATACYTQNRSIIISTPWKDGVSHH
ncbi:retrovirus-related pol polyprotein from transposon TNT 1-94 [Tanacetum coccineum]